MDSATDVARGAGTTAPTAVAALSGPARRGYKGAERTAMGRAAHLVCLHDHADYFGGGHEVLVRVATIAARRAVVDLGVLWGPVGTALTERAAGCFGAVARFDFPDGLRLRSLGAHRAAMRRLRQWTEHRGAAGLLAFGLRAALRAAMVARQLHLPVAWMCQQGSPLFEPPHASVKRTVAGRLLRAAGAHVVCPSVDGRAALARLGLPPARLHHIPNGVACGHLAAYTLADGEKRAWRAAHGIAPADLIVVCVARLDPIKDHGLLLEAVAAAGRGGTRIGLVCVGAAAPGRHAYAEALRGAAADLGIASQVVWAGHQHDVGPWLAMADAAALASRRESQPLALIEAAALGLPLVASRVGGVPEIVRSGETGLLFDPRDTAACAAALVALARDPARRRSYGARARHVAETEFDTTQADARWARFLEDWLAA